MKMTSGGPVIDPINELETMEISPIEETTIKLLSKVARSDAYFRSQQIGDADLTTDEKYSIARDILAKGPSQFLARFARVLNCYDMTYFEQFRGNYEVDFYLKQIAERTNPRTSKLTVKNRRYEALKKLVSEGEYFSDSEMRRRNPLVFEQLVGQYMDQSERDAIDTIDKADLRFTTILMEHIDRDNERAICQQQMEELSFKEEFDSDEDDIAEDESQDKTESTKISREEKSLLRQEFVSIMHQRFLDGKEEDFNYSSVDDNSEYDNIQVKQQDAEDGYFDAEEPHDLESD